MADGSPDPVENTPEESASQPDQPSNQQQQAGCLLGCLCLGLFIFITPSLLMTLGGWAWCHIAGLAILFFVIKAFTNKVIMVVIAITTIGGLAIFLNGFHRIEKPLCFDHNTLQKSDQKVMMELFRLSEFPPSFKIEKVFWHGEDWFPSQGLRASQYAADVDAGDLGPLLAKVSGHMKDSKPGSADFGFVMNESERQSLMVAPYEKGGKPHWKQYNVEIKEKLQTIRWFADLAWDEKTSPSLRLYIRVIPE